MTQTRENEYELTVDTNGVPRIEILAKHKEGEIWASIHGNTRLCTSILLYADNREWDIRGDVLQGWIARPAFRTLEDIHELKESMEAWKAPEPDFGEVVALGCH